MSPPCPHADHCSYITTAEAAEDPLTICSTSAELGEFGVYDLHEERSCAVTEALAPVNTNLALLVVFLVIALGCAAWWALNRAAGGAVTRAAQLLGWDKDSASKSSIRRFVITEKAPTRAFSWLKAATTAFTIKTLLRH